MRKRFCIFRCVKRYRGLLKNYLQVYFAYKLVDHIIVFCENISENISKNITNININLILLILLILILILDFVKKLYETL